MFNIHTGTTDYFGTEHLQNNCDVLKASSSLPVFSPIVRYQGKNILTAARRRRFRLNRR